MKEKEKKKQHIWIPNKRSLCVNVQIDRLLPHNLLANGAAIRKQHANKIQMCARDDKKTLQHVREQGLEVLTATSIAFLTSQFNAWLRQPSRCRGPFEIISWNRCTIWHCDNTSHVITIEHQWKRDERRSTTKVTATNLANEQNTCTGTHIKAIAWSKLTYFFSNYGFNGQSLNKIVFQPDFTWFCLFASTFLSQHRQSE